jgi:hypothetical protein
MLVTLSRKRVRPKAKNDRFNVPQANANEGDEAGAVARQALA